MRTIVLAVLVLGSSSCLSDRELREDRLAHQIELWRRENPGVKLDAETIAHLEVEATKAADEEIAAEKRASAEKLGAGVSSALSGNYVGGGILLLGAIATYLGIGRTRLAKAPEPSTTPPPGGGLTGEKGAEKSEP